MKKTLKILTVLTVLCLLFAGCKEKSAKRNFEKKGLQIAFPEDFVDYSETTLAQNYDFLFAGDFIGVLGVSEEKSALPDDVTDLKSCAVYMAESHGTQMEEKDGFYTFTYEDLEINEPQMYISVVLEAADYYWIVSAYCPSDIYNENAAQMWAYITAAKTANK